MNVTVTSTGNYGWVVVQVIGTNWGCSSIPHETATELTGRQTFPNGQYELKVIRTEAGYPVGRCECGIDGCTFFEVQTPGDFVRICAPGSAALGLVEGEKVKFKLRRLT
jgi:hypothetical protein